MKGRKHIDINMDLGEGMTNESALFPFVSSCNIACGGHYGDDETIKATVLLAMAHQVKIGVHPSFPDRANFGRKVLNISIKELQDSVRHQIINFMSVLDKLGVDLHHVKPHGALYNLAAKDREVASALIEVLLELQLQCLVYAPNNSEFSKAAMTQGFKVWHEAFADRRYNANGSLVSRVQNNAVITEAHELVGQVLEILNSGTVTTVEGQNLKILADTICVHGDTPNAALLVKTLHKELIAKGYDIG